MRASISSNGPGPMSSSAPDLALDWAGSRTKTPLPVRISMAPAISSAIIASRIVGRET